MRKLPTSFFLILLHAASAAITLEYPPTFKNGSNGVIPCLYTPNFHQMIHDSIIEEAARNMAEASRKHAIQKHLALKNSSPPPAPYQISHTTYLIVAIVDVQEVINVVKFSIGKRQMEIIPSLIWNPKDVCNKHDDYLFDLDIEKFPYDVTEVVNNKIRKNLLASVVIDPSSVRGPSAALATIRPRKIELRMKELIIAVICNLDGSYFPFDVQVCQYEEQLITKLDKGDVNFTSVCSMYFGMYQKNAVWDLLGCASHTYPLKDPIRKMAMFVRTTTFVFKRFASNAILNHYLPVATLSFMLPFVFLLSDDLPFKPAYILTLMLAMVVFASNSWKLMPPTNSALKVADMQILALLVFAFISSVMITRCGKDRRRKRAKMIVFVVLMILVIVVHLQYTIIMLMRPVVVCRDEKTDRHNPGGLQRLCFYDHPEHKNITVSLIYDEH